MVRPYSAQVTVESGSASSSNWKVRRTQRQTKPYTDVLPFSYLEGESKLLGVGPPYAPYGVGTYALGPSSSEFRKLVSLESTRNKCREKLYGKMSEKASWAASAAEGRQSLNMIASRAIQLRQAFQAVRRAEFGRAARVLGLDHTPKRVSAKKQVSNNWLEFHFGWSPLVSDIYTSVDILQNPKTDHRVSASAKSHGTVTSGGYPAFPPYGRTARRSYAVYSVRSGFTYEVENHDLWLANKLGLVNPALVAWELVPFSFVVDWFIPVGDFLGSMSATWGTRVINGWTTEKSFYEDHRLSKIAVDYVRMPDVQHWGHCTQLTRTVGALSATPTLTPSFSFSPTRALTSITLLIQQLKGR